MSMTRTPATFAASLQALIQSIPQLISDRVVLLSLELRRAGKALAVITGCVITSAVCLATAWTALWLGIATALVDAGWPRYGVAAAVALANVMVTVGALTWARSQVHRLGLPATIRHLTVHGPQTDDAKSMGDSKSTMIGVRDE